MNVLLKGRGGRVGWYVLASHIGGEAFLAGSISDAW